MRLAKLVHSHTLKRMRNRSCIKVMRCHAIFMPAGAMRRTVELDHALQLLIGDNQPR
jgi:hypothetical protein